MTERPEDGESPAAAGNREWLRAYHISEILIEEREGIRGSLSEAIGSGIYAGALDGKSMQNSGMQIIDAHGRTARNITGSRRVPRRKGAE